MSLSCLDLETMWDTVLDKQQEWYNLAGLPSWTNVRGPIGATVLSLSRIDWVPVNYHTWTDDRGVTLDLFDYSPQMFHSLLEDAHHRNVHITMWGR